MDIIETYINQNPQSRAAYQRAKKVLPSGSTRTVLFWPPFPLFMMSGQGTKIWDLDENERFDYNYNNTTLILGHNHPRVMAAIQEQLSRGTVLGAPTETEQKLAEELLKRLEGAGMVRFTPSGTEANMQAVRTARSHTGKDLVAKCEGAYHGSWDAMDISIAPKLDRAGPRDAPKSVRQHEGIPQGVLDNTLIIPYNDTESAEKIIKRHREKLAAVIVEPMQRDLPPEPGFLEMLRDITERNNIVLIFDEVISFRLSYNGAQGVFEVIPDITTMGKIIGGGFPVGAYSLSEEIMKPLLIPETKFPNYKSPRLGFSGTFNAHPVTMAAGLAVMEEMKPNVYENMNRLGSNMRDGLKTILEEVGILAFVGGLGSFFPVMWTSEKVMDYRSAATANHEIARYFSLDIMNRGVFLLGHPNISAVSTDNEITVTLEIMRESMENIKPIIKKLTPNLLT